MIFRFFSQSVAIFNLVIKLIAFNEYVKKTHHTMTFSAIELISKSQH